MLVHLDISLPIRSTSIWYYTPVSIILDSKLGLAHTFRTEAIPDKSAATLRILHECNETAIRCDGTAPHLCVVAPSSGVAWRMPILLDCFPTLLARWQTMPTQFYQWYILRRQSQINIGASRASQTSNLASCEASGRSTWSSAACSLRQSLRIPW